MEDELYIPKKLKIGFQERSDTFTKKLAYVIYFDDKGVLRKEKSWQSWRDHKIDPVEYDNSPISGFCLNKDIKRGGYEWHSTARTMIRVHDPRNFEFEITTQNLIGVLMNTDCSKRGLVGEFVYAWYGTELVLLPVCSEEYENSVKYTKKLESKVSAKSLVPGYEYTQKRSDSTVVYLGRFNWYEYVQEKQNLNVHVRKPSKKHIFVEKYQVDKNDKMKIFPVASTNFLAGTNSTEPVSNYAELVKKFGNKTNSSDLKLELIENTDELTFKSESVDWYHDRKTLFVKHKNALDKPVLWAIHASAEYRSNYNYNDGAKQRLNTFSKCQITVESSIDLTNGTIVKPEHHTYVELLELMKNGKTIPVFTKEDKEKLKKKYGYYNSYSYGHNYEYPNINIRESLSDFVFYKIRFIFENGKTKLLKFKNDYYWRTLDFVVDEVD